MGNTSTKEQWAGRERLAFIERAAWWRGTVNRGDLREVFGISTAQASADLQGYQGMNPGALNYNLSSKRYEAAAEMKCVLHEPRLEDALRVITGAAAVFPRSGAGTVEVFMPPARRAGGDVERRIFLAVENRLRVTVKYWSVSSGRAGKRVIAPHALAHDGYRWHVRAWCFENGDFRDFVLSRIEAADWPEEPFMPPDVDDAWETILPLTLRANPELPEDARRAIERDYGMKNGTLVLSVRKAMRDYVLGHLRIPASKDYPAHLVRVE